MWVATLVLSTIVAEKLLAFYYSVWHSCSFFIVSFSGWRSLLLALVCLAYFLFPNMIGAGVCHMLPLHLLFPLGAFLIPSVELSIFHFYKVSFSAFLDCLVQTSPPITISSPVSQSCSLHYSMNEIIIWPYVSIIAQILMTLVYNLVFASTYNSSV